VSLGAPIQTTSNITDLFKVADNQLSRAARFYARHNILETITWLVMVEASVNELLDEIRQEAT
jgi:hypothetical protein